MKVLMANGSPHKNGSTFTALNIIGEELNKYGIDYEIVHIAGKPISGCTACYTCKKNGGVCVIDDVLNEFVEKAKECDGFVFGSPVYFAGASGQLISFMNRLFIAGKDFIKYKPAMSVVCGRRAGTTNTFDQINKYIQFNNMLQVPSKYWNMMIGRNADEVLGDEEGVEIMKNLAKNMAWLLKTLQVAKQAGVEIPQ